MKKIKLVKDLKMSKKGKSFKVIVEDPYEVERKFGINQVNPEHAKTKLLDLFDNKKSHITLVNSTKKSSDCEISVVDFKTKEVRKKNTLYHCFWCKHEIETDLIIGCPIKYMHNQLIKNIKNDVNAEIYSIRENTYETTDSSVKALNTKNINCEFERKNYYVVDGAFCSFECTLAFIRDNSKNDFYANSEMLLYKMYLDIHEEFDITINQVPDLISCAPHWRLLKIFGGNLSIESFRSSFNHKFFTTHDYLKVIQAPNLLLYEQQIRL
jgi:hypothetical protein